jgi:hypothetical protein
MFSASTSQLEAWANSIVQAVAAGRYQEDDRVEFKSDWIEAKKAARRIAGAANAARGVDLMWIIGADPRRSQPFTDPPQIELAQWLPAVKACFVEAHTPVFRGFQVQVGSHACYALAFDSEEAPFLIKNPSKGTERTEVIEFEVPWREGTMTRSARRGELLSILYRRVPLPDFEVRSAKYRIHHGQERQDEAVVKGAIDLEIYIVPRSTDPIVLPVHRVSWSIDGQEAREVALEAPDCQISDLSSALSLGIKPALSRSPSRIVVEAPETLQTRVTGTEIILFGPAVVQITLRFSASREVLYSTVPISGYARFEVGADRIPITVVFEAPPRFPPFDAGTDPGS